MCLFILQMNTDSFTKFIINMPIQIVVILNHYVYYVLHCYIKLLHNIIALRPGDVVKY